MSDGNKLLVQVAALRKRHAGVYVEQGRTVWHSTAQPLKLLARYRPVERLARQWIAELHVPAARVYRLRVYHSFVAAYRRCWPRWPSYPRLVLNREARGAIDFDEVAVATIA